MFSSKATFQALVVTAVFHNKDYRMSKGLMARGDKRNDVLLDQA
jgi:hypothetical protein